MNQFKIALHSLLHALGVLLYIVLVASIMTNAERIFGKMDKDLLGPIAFLLLFTISATITGLLVLGRPNYLFLNDRKKEAVTFLSATLGWLVAITVVVFIILFVIR